MKAKWYVAIVAGTAIFVVYLVWGLTWIVPEMYYMDDEYPAWQQQKDYVFMDSDKQESIFLGDSRMKAAISPILIDDKAYNLALGGGAPLMMYYTLKNYLEHHPVPDKVIMGYGLGHYSSYGSYRNRMMYFHYLNQEEMKEFIEVMSNMDGISDNRKKEELQENYQYSWRLPIKYYKTLVKSMFMRKEKNDEVYNSCAEYKGLMHFGTKDSDAGLDVEGTLKGFGFLPGADFYLRKTIELCYKNGIPVYIEQLPMNPMTINGLRNSSAYRQYQEYMDELAKLPGVKYVNREIPCFEPEMFGDCSHLNQRGTEKFSAYIKNKYF